MLMKGSGVKKCVVCLFMMFNATFNNISVISWGSVLLLDETGVPVLSGEAINANFIIFGLTRSGLEPTIYRTRCEHANHYTTDAVV